MTPYISRAARAGRYDERCDRDEIGEDGIDGRHGVHSRPPAVTGRGPRRFGAIRPRCHFKASICRRASLIPWGEVQTRSAMASTSSPTICRPKLRAMSCWRRKSSRVATQVSTVRRDGIGDLGRLNAVIPPLPAGRISARPARACKGWDAPSCESACRSAARRCGLPSSRSLGCCFPSLSNDRAGVGGSLLRAGRQSAQRWRWADPDTLAPLWRDRSGRQAAMKPTAHGAVLRLDRLALAGRPAAGRGATGSCVACYIICSTN